MHAFAIVLVKPSDDVASEVGRLIAPFMEGSPECEAQFDADGNETAAYVPGRFWWDWYRIGGRQDGKVRSVRYETAPGCTCNVERDGNAFSIVSRKPGDSDCHYSDRHEQLERNVAPVPDLRELQCFTLVTPEGEFRHRLGARHGGGRSRLRSLVRRAAPRPS